MKTRIRNFALIPVFVTTLIILQTEIKACTLIKITSNGKTIVGNNEDFSNPDTRIWFEPGAGKQFGAVYVGYDNLFPEGGINEAGLMFDAFGVTNKPLKDTTGKLPIFELDLKRKIMKECSTVEQVNLLIGMYNLYFWSHAVWIFADKSGNYLIVDGDSRTLENDKYFVQTNFRHSEIKDDKEITCARYLKAMAMLNSRSEASSEYCTALMDSVHVQGTLYTTVYDLNNGTIDLYNYHNYSKVKRFNVKDELKKGNRVLRIPELFPEVINPSYKGFLNLKSTFDSLAFYFTARDSVRRTAIINDLKKRDYIIHVLGNYGYEFLHQGKIQKAIGIFTLITEFYPQMPYGFQFLGEAYMENKQYQLAQANYRQSVKLYPADVEVWQRINLLNELLSH